MGKYAKPTGVLKLTLDRVSKMASKIDMSGECWIWNGYVNPVTGYGSYHIRPRTVRAHRAVYELVSGKTLDPLITLDHLCRNRRCVNPQHLDPVEGKINILRGYSLPALNARKTHCPQGHEYTEENTQHDKNGRACKTCARQHTRNWRARKRLLASKRGEREKK